LPPRNTEHDQVFGLAFFAILMTEINSVNDALGLKLKGSNKIKNDMVTFMKYKKFNEVRGPRAAPRARLAPPADLSRHQLQ
jgi:hypothetical protein